MTAGVMGQFSAAGERPWSGNLPGWEESGAQASTTGHGSLPGHRGSSSRTSNTEPLPWRARPGVGCCWFGWRHPGRLREPNRPPFGVGRDSLECPAIPAQPISTVASTRFCWALWAILTNTTRPNRADQTSGFASTCENRSACASFAAAGGPSLDPRIHLHPAAPIHPEPIPRPLQLPHADAVRVPGAGDDHHPRRVDLPRMASPGWTFTSPA
jgi:hypothetical protein